MNNTRTPQHHFVTLRISSLMQDHSGKPEQTGKSSEFRFAVVTLAFSLFVIGTGCLQNRPATQFPPPPGLAPNALSQTDGKPTGAVTTGAVTTGAVTTGAVTMGAVTNGADTVTAARPAQEPASAYANGPMPSGHSQTIVRGQDSGGFVMPSLPTISADGGRHNRAPLPVSGQRTTVAQASPTQAGTAQTGTGNPASNPNSTGISSPVMQTQGFGELPPPGMSEPLVAPPGVPNGGFPSTGVPQSSFPAPTSQPMPQAGFGMQPGYDVLPEISSESLNYDPSQPIGIPYEPTTRIADIIVNGYPARTGRIMFGGAVNSDAGVTGQITVEERNFDITRWPTSFGDLIGGTAFRGAGQTLRIEAVPGNVLQRYSVNFTEPFLFGYMPISMSVSGFLFDRRFQDWDEQRLGGRLNFGYRITPDLSISAGLRGEQVDITRPRVLGIPQLDAVLGESEIYSGQLRLTHDTRNSPFAPSEGHYMEFTYEQAFGDYDFPRFEASYNKYFLVRERADGSGRQTFTTGINVGYSGEDTPIFENFFAGGYTTLRGFEFRGASPSVSGVQVGGRFQLLGTFEYMFPLTADDMLRAVAFLDYGTVEDEVQLERSNFRLAPGFGLRIAVPALGPAPLAFDFAFPVMDAAGDEQQTFSFYMGLTRRM